MKTKYGNLPPTAFEKYRNALINRVWMLIPLKEENCKTIDKNIGRLNRELCGMARSLPNHEEYIITVMNLLENLISENDFLSYRADVLRCCELMKKVTEDEGGDADV